MFKINGKKITSENSMSIPCQKSQENIKLPYGGQVFPDSLDPKSMCNLETLGENYTQATFFQAVNDMDAAEAVDF